MAVQSVPAENGGGVRAESSVSLKHLNGVGNVASNGIPANGHTLGGPAKNDFFEAAADLLKDYHKESYDVKRPVLALRSPKEIENEFVKAGVPLSLTDGEPVDESKILTAMEKTLELGVRMNHPLFLNQLTAGLNSVGLAGEWLIGATNTNCHTYEVGFVFSLSVSLIIGTFLPLNHAR